MTDTEKMQAALAAAQPTAEEVATRVYLEAMVADGFALSWLDTDPVISKYVPCTVDELMAMLKSATTSFHVERRKPLCSMSVCYSKPETSEDKQRDIDKKERREREMYERLLAKYGAE